jgi:hypothetical protein
VAHHALLLGQAAVDHFHHLVSPSVGGMPWKGLTIETTARCVKLVHRAVQPNVA